MSRAWQIAGACLLAFFAVVVYLSFKLRLTDALGPGPGFFPFWLSLIGIGLCVVMILDARRSMAADGGSARALFPEAALLRRGASVLAWLVVAAALFDIAGYRLTTLIFIAGLLVSLGARSPVGIAVSALAGSLGVFHVFYHYLKVPLPIGMLGI